jgi:TolA-binding protein
MLCSVAMGQHEHPAEATKFFDQGLTLVFGFNHDEAVRSFQRAAELDRNPRNPRSLFGLGESLKAQKKLADAEWVRREFEAAWKNADATLRIADL